MNLEMILTPTDAKEFNVVLMGLVGVWILTEKKSFKLEEVMELQYNLRHVQWDGKCILFIYFCLKY
jgi:hypothetical protein